MAEKKCDIQTPEYIVLPSEGGGVPGPQGPVGPIGPPGLGSLPVPAKDVSVTGHEPLITAQEIFDKLLYILIEILTFISTKETYELGQTISVLGFSWTLNKTTVTSQKITGAHTESGLEIGPTALSTAANFAPPLGTGALLPFSSVFTLAVNDGETIVTKTKTINFFSGVYWGDAEEPAVINSDFLNNLLHKDLQASRNSVFMSDAFPPAPDKEIYTWYANRAPLGIANFNAGGFDGGFQTPSTIAFTNEFGITEQYYVYRSDFPNIGTVKIIVS